MTRTNRGLRGSFGLLIATLATGACTDSTGLDALDDAFLLDMALVAADATIEDVNLWGQPLTFGPLAGPGAQGHTHTPGVPGGHGGFAGSGTRSVTFFDADDDEQDAYDALTTASMHILHDVQGEVQRESWTATISRQRDKWVTGLVGEETHRTWNGTGSEQVTRSRHLDDGTERSYESSGTIVYEDVVVPIPGSTPRWPVSGTITRSMTVTGTGADGTTTRAVEIVITFDGTAIATALVNGELIEIDLSVRSGRNPVRRGRGG